MERRPLDPPTPAAYRKTPRQADAWREGYAAGYHSATAVWNDPPKYGREIWTERDGRIVPAPDNIAELMESLAFEAEAHARQYSPFEELASSFNRARNADALWSAYDEGVAEGVFACLAGWEAPTLSR